VLVNFGFRVGLKFVHRGVGEFRFPGWLKTRSPYAYSSVGEFQFPGWLKNSFSVVSVNFGFRVGFRIRSRGVGEFQFPGWLKNSFSVVLGNFSFRVGLRIHSPWWGISVSGLA
jgi:hypothetical protein